MPAKVKKLSRRAFIRAASTAGCAAALGPLLAACGREVVLPSMRLPAPTETVVPQPTSTSFQIRPTATLAPAATAMPVSTKTVPVATDTSVPAETPAAALASTATPAGVPDLVVARGGEPEELVRRAVAALGGMEKFVSKGARVVVKPNICTSYYTYEYATTTNPWVVAALVKLCLEAGAKTVQVFDYPFGGALVDAYAKSGIADQVKAAGGDMTFMLAYQYVDVNIPNGTSLKKTKAYKDALEADVIIDVPIAKHHSSTRLTLGMKNLMGIIQNRNIIHGDLWHRIPDLASLFRPRLTVIDAVRILTAHGPAGGSLDDVQKLDTVIASPDIVAADAYATSLFSLKPEDIPYIPAAAEAGLGRMDLDNLRIEEIAVGG